MTMLGGNGSSFFTRGVSFLLPDPPSHKTDNSSKHRLEAWKSPTQLQSFLDLHTFPQGRDGATSTPADQCQYSITGHWYILTDLTNYCCTVSAITTQCQLECIWGHKKTTIHPKSQMSAQVTLISNRKTKAKVSNSISRQVYRKQEEDCTPVQNWLTVLQVYK